MIQLDLTQLLLDYTVPYRYLLYDIGTTRYLQLGGGSSVISPSSFWILLADVLMALDSLGVGFSFLDLSGVSLLARLEPDSLDIMCCLKIAAK